MEQSGQSLKSLQTAGPSYTSPGEQLESEIYLDREENTESAGRSGILGRNSFGRVTSMFVGRVMNKRRVCGAADEAHS